MTKPTHHSAGLRQLGLSKIGPIAGILTLASGCLADPDEPPVLLGEEPPPCEVAIEHYRIDALEVPTSATSSLQLGLDLDGDVDMRPDNAGGSILSAFLGQYQSAASDLATALEAKLADGRLRWVLRVETCAAGDEAWVRAGLHRALDGDDDGILEIVEHPRPAAGGWLQGRMLRVETGFGPVPVSPLVDVLDADDTVEWVAGDGVTIEATFAEDGSLAGKLGVGLPEPETRAIIAPRLASFFTYKLGRGESEYAATLDTDDDGVVTLGELDAGGILNSLLGRDVDLFDETEAPPVFWPLHDLTNDRISFGLGFQASPTAVE